MICSATVPASAAPEAKFTATANPRLPASLAILAPIPRLPPVTISVPLLASAFISSILFKARTNVAKTFVRVRSA
jgi:hypothetical protein